MLQLLGDFVPHTLYWGFTPESHWWDPLLSTGSKNLPNPQLFNSQAAKLHRILAGYVLDSPRCGYDAELAWVAGYVPRRYTVNGHPSQY